MPLLPLPPDLLRELAENAVDLGIDAQGNRHWATAGQGLDSEGLLRDLRYAGRDSQSYATAWHSPLVRGILLASEGHAELILYATPRGYDSALRDARQGVVPSPLRAREPEVER